MLNEHHGFSHPTEEEIAQCAYLIWEGEGRPAGREKEHWLQAETQLMACRAHEGWTNGATKPTVSAEPAQRAA
jgi:hypothetical protein